MDGFDQATYGDRFADVYDDWYGAITDTDACVKAVADLVAEAGDGPRTGDVLELGVGTGRLAVPLAGLGLRVTGVDASFAMLDRLASKPGGDAVETVLGDMADPPVGDATFAVVLVAYNTLFNLVDDGAQARCLAAAAAHLAPGGSVVVEAFVPHDDAQAASVVEPTRVSADRVVLSVSRSDPGRRLVQGQFVDITEGGIRLRPWQVRWATPAELDALADQGGLRLHARWSDWQRSPFDEAAQSHVSIYR
jgi:SAM-dependent methyltransferase